MLCKHQKTSKKHVGKLWLAYFWLEPIMFSLFSTGTATELSIGCRLRRCVDGRFQMSKFRWKCESVMIKIYDMDDIRQMPFVYSFPMMFIILNPFTPSNRLQILSSVEKTWLPSCTALRPCHKRTSGRPAADTLEAISQNLLFPWGINIH